MRKKLIEVALPLEAINKASAREKSIRHGHPSTLHLWWARRPLAAARAVIFSQMVDDPSEYTDVLLSDPVKKRAAERELRKREQEAGSEKRETLAEVAADIERQRLFRIIEDLVLWENTTNEEVLDRAREEIWQSWRRACAENVDHPRANELFDRHKLPAFHDPFAGGGSLPLEAQRLGLEAYASDLNPVAVLINKAMIEIPPKFAGREPVNPEWQAKPPEEKAMRHWKGAQGLAEDVRYYGKWMREEAEKRIGHLYPKVTITQEMARERPDLGPYVGHTLRVVAYLWARTVRSPDPAFANSDVPLTSTFILSTNPTSEAYVEPQVEQQAFRFVVRRGVPADPGRSRAGTKLGRGSNFSCLLSGTPISGQYIKAEGQAGRMGARLMALVVDAQGGRVYLSPSPSDEAHAKAVAPNWEPEGELVGKCRDQLPLYGMNTFAQAFTTRQLVAMTTFSDLAGEARRMAQRDSAAAGLPSLAGGAPLEEEKANIYADAISVYLSCVVSAVADDLSSIVTWRSGHGTGATRSTFARQALPMVWDYAEVNPFASAAGDIGSALVAVSRSIDMLPASVSGHAFQADAVKVTLETKALISTDPPYYDNIGYADLSEFFYVWLRPSMRQVFPSLFATLAVPKTEELIAAPHRHGSRELAETFFLDGMTRAFSQISEQSHPGFPMTVYYAFKQAETDDDFGTSSTGWEVFLDALITVGLSICGTWPIRTERLSRSVGIGTNSLASSIVLVCRPRDAESKTVTRRDFISALLAELPNALKNLQRGNIAPVDLAQAAIGPGMAIYTRHSKVLNADGNPLSVRDALTIINQALDAVLAEQEGDFDSDTRWALAWFEQFGFAEGEYGVAETLSKAKNTSVGGMEEAGIVKSGSGKVRLFRPSELPEDWDPDRDKRLTVWEMVHHLIRVLESGGESAAAELVAGLGAKAEVARELAYRLYTLCERKKRAAEALSYNGLVQSWPEISRLARSREQGAGSGKQAELFEE